MPSQQILQTTSRVVSGTLLLCGLGNGQMCMKLNLPLKLILERSSVDLTTEVLSIRKRTGNEEETSTSSLSSLVVVSNKDSECKKQKTYSFQKTWETGFLAVQNDDNTGVICLLCSASLSGFRKANCQRHHETHHSVFMKEYPVNSDARLHKVSDLKIKFQCQQKLFSSNSNNNKLSTEVSIDVSNKLVRQGMPFSVGEVVKDCIVSAVTTLVESIPEKYRSIMINVAKNVPISNDTVARRVNVLSAQMKENTRQKLSEFVYFLLAVDESTDVASVAQLMCFVRCIDSHGTVDNLFLTVLPLPGSTTGQDIYTAVTNFFVSSEIDVSKLVCVVTDGAPSMVGKNKGFVTLLKKDERFPSFIHFHCLIHVENLASHFQSVPEIPEHFKVIVKVINFFAAKPLNKCLLRVFLQDLSAPHFDLILHTDVRWLSRGKTISCVWELFEEIKAFISSSGYAPQFPQLYKDDFKVTLAFIVDLFEYLNEVRKYPPSRTTKYCY
ncbi:SCAN domain-containing protein 3-like isoform X1 [Bacillus rossius redtenbacheri]|uniref:SCAN domain-containing protein 3-like isoform X1 n=1 Tax=Bacillus rossius redtenbacheri TaxID=93214 RepID=UPI002FDCDA6B